MARADLSCSDFAQDEERIQPGALVAQSLLDLFSNSGVIKQSLAGSLGAVVAL